MRTICSNHKIHFFSTYIFSPKIHKMYNMKLGRKKIGFLWEKYFIPGIPKVCNAIYSLSKLLIVHGPIPIFIPLWTFLSPLIHKMMFCCCHCSHWNVLLVIVDVTKKTAQAWNYFYTGKFPRIVTTAVLVDLNL